MTVLVVLTVIVIVLLIAGLAVYLYWAGTLLDRIGGKLEGAAGIVRGIVADAEQIGPGVEHINQTGGVVAGALPLLYGMAEEIVADVTPAPPRPEVPEVARPASGTRRSRLLSSVGYRPELSGTDPRDSPAPVTALCHPDVSTSPIVNFRNTSGRHRTGRTGHLSIGCDHFDILLSFLTISAPDLSGLSPRK